MDSPLLPRLQSATNADDDLLSPLADLSLVSAGTPGPSQLYRGGSAGGSSSQSRGVNSAGSNSAGIGASGSGGQSRLTTTAVGDGWDTPERPRGGDMRGMRVGAGVGAGAGRIAATTGGAGGAGVGKAKPRFSLFAPGANAGGPASSGSGPSRFAANSRELHANPSGGGRQEVPNEQEEDEQDLNRREDDVDADGGDELEGDETIQAHDQVQDQDSDERTGDGVGPQSKAQREDKLRESLYELRGMNEVFEGFLAALESARGHNERLAARVKETSALLDEYTSILGQAEHTQRLLSNPNWTGLNDDYKAQHEEELARIAREQAAREEAERAAEAARLAEEERERKLAEAKERAKDAGSTGTGRGGTRGRGGLGRGAAPRGRGSGIPAPTTRQPSGGKPPPTLRKAPSGVGLAGQYANVKSSGYGPARKAT